MSDGVNPLSFPFWPCGHLCLSSPAVLDAKLSLPCLSLCFCSSSLPYSFDLLCPSSSSSSFRESSVVPPLLPVVPDVTPTNYQQANRSLKANS